MKKFTTPTLLLGMGILAMSLTACGHNDSLVGTWRATSSTDKLTAAFSGKAASSQPVPQSGPNSTEFIFSADKAIIKVVGQPETITEIKYLKGTSDKSGTTYQLTGSGFGANGATAVVAPNGDTATIDLGPVSMELKRE